MTDERTLSNADIRITADRADTEIGDGEEDFKPLTPEEAQSWRVRQLADSPWRVVGWQLLLMLLLTLVVWLIGRRSELAWSALYGGLCVVLPTGVMAYGVTSSALARMLPGVARASLAGLVLWEGVKLILALSMLWMAPRWIPGLNWLALVAGLVVVLKAYWLELWWRTRRASGPV